MTRGELEKKYQEFLEDYKYPDETFVSPGYSFPEDLLDWMMGIIDGAEDDHAAAIAAKDEEIADFSRKLDNVIDAYMRSVKERNRLSEEIKNLNHLIDKAQVLRGEAAERFLERMDAVDSIANWEIARLKDRISELELNRDIADDNAKEFVIKITDQDEEIARLKAENVCRDYQFHDFLAYTDRFLDRQEEKLAEGQAIIDAKEAEIIRLRKVVEATVSLMDRLRRGRKLRFDADFMDCTRLKEEAITALAKLDEVKNG